MDIYKILTVIFGKWLKFISLSVQLNSFQAVLAMDGVSSYILFLYKDLQWTTSDACPSSLPQAGISAGDGVRSFTLPSSGTTNVVSLTQTSSAGVPGLHILSSSEGKLRQLQNLWHVTIEDINLR